MYIYLVTCVEIPVVYVTSASIGEHEGLQPPLGRLLGYVLDEAQPAFETYHALIH